ncbi:thiamine pyrophosphate-requiring protein [Glutamicibacter uratoxydans]|uniref:Thiamine pyrophosphate-requiring protein n=1 Tax=Glutamicibacter uratoxydans TaxID=43667 RepID=A0A4Y4DN47_GLUUR|nr:thiamine pyrophosphate-requiring protein [Glutamicibacter uratoxydans]GED05030.1 thiamine pyrophosphate-requiring protein [Glutamicibacter uratoxydans]
MALLVSDHMVSRLKDWGVSRIFGYSGDGINTFLSAVRRGGIPFVQARHEEAAGFMAVAHSKFSVGQFGLEARKPAADLGVVVSTQGPGAVHLLNALYDAKLDSVPVLAIVGQQNRPALGSDYQQEIDLEALFADVACYREEVATPVQLRPVMDRAIRSALAKSGPAVVIVPHDVQQMGMDEPDGTHAQMPTAAQWQPPRTIPSDPEIKEAAALLDSSRRIAFLVGQGARHAQEEVERLARHVDAAVVTSLLGKPYIDESSPMSAGVMGHLGTTASAAVLNECDALLIIGSNDPWTEFYPPPGQARAVQIDISASRLGNRYPIEVGLAGEAAATLRELRANLAGAPGHRRAWREQVQHHVANWHQLRRERAAVPMNGVNPEALVAELSAQLPEQAQIALDVGSCVYWYARQLSVPPKASAHLCSTLASMGAGVPYGLAAKLLHPDRPAIVLAGDGGMQMSGIAELITVADRWRQWEDPRFVVCVLANKDLAEVSWEQRETEGDPRFQQSQQLPHFSYAQYAKMLGLAGIEVQPGEDLEDLWRLALSERRPVVLEVHTDPNTPLLPPRASDKQLESMMSGLREEDNAEGLDLLQKYVDLERRIAGA